MTTLRRLSTRTSSCQRCGAEIAWARTLASPTGTGGKAMPLDPIEDPNGNVAVRQLKAGHGYVTGLVARVLAKDEGPIHGQELLAMPHFATCKPKPTPPGVTDLNDYRRRRKKPQVR